MEDHWQIYHRAWSQLAPPLRPHGDVVIGVADQIKDRPGRALLLGVTPEYADIAGDLVAVDHNPAMIVNLWPGNTLRRHAVAADWRNPNFAPGVFSVCVGDGSLCVLAFPVDVRMVLHQLKRVLKSGGRIVSRVYLSPDRAETATNLRDAALAGAVGNFHAFKLRLAMALTAAQPTPQVRVGAILDAFDAMFADRSRLAAATGWAREQIDTIDLYKGSVVLFGFPTRDQLLSVVAPFFHGASLVPCGSYELAERCPLLVAEAS